MTRRESPDRRDSSSRPLGAVEAGVRMAPWELAPEGQWPVEDRQDAAGSVVQPRFRAMTRDEIMKEALDKVTHHLTIACSWPRERSHRINVVGAYRFYVLEFAPREGVALYAQVWCEPGAPLLFEVSSGHAHNPTRAFISQQMQDALLGRGFEVGGAVKNFRKKIIVTEPPAIQATAREMLAIMVDVFGYDGTSALTFRLHQDFRTGSGQLFRGIQPDDFRRLLAQWGIVGTFEPCAEPRIAARSVGVAFGVSFHLEMPPPFSCYEVVELATTIETAPGKAPQVVDKLGPRLLLAKAVAKSPTELVITLTMLAAGGVTSENLREQTLRWLGEVGQIVKMVKG